MGEIRVFFEEEGGCEGIGGLDKLLVPFFSSLETNFRVIQKWESLGRSFELTLFFPLTLAEITLNEVIYEVKEKSWEEA